MRITQDNELRTGPDMEIYVVHLLKNMQGGICARVNCTEPLSTGYQIAHKRYGADITLYDLGFFVVVATRKTIILRPVRDY